MFTTEKRVILLVLVAIVSASNVEDENNLEDISAYGYHTKVGMSLAEEIRQAEEEAIKDPSRIDDSSITRLGQFPYQAGLLIDLSDGQSACGGSLLNSRRVLTAAHCWFDGLNQAWRFIVVLGSVTLFSGGTRLSTNNVIMPNSWTPSFIRNDIAMIKLPRRVSATANIAPIALPAGSELTENFAGNTAVASGFGVIRDGGIIYSTLQHVNLSVITNAVCEISYQNYITASNICTSSIVNGKCTCRGDSGGPLVITRGRRRILIGVTSFGSIRGCRISAPTVFTRVTLFISWIQGHL